MSKFVETLRPVLNQMAFDALVLLQKDGFIIPYLEKYGAEVKKREGCYTGSISFHPRNSGRIDVALFGSYHQTPTINDPKINLEIPTGFEFGEPDLSVGREIVAVHGSMDPHLVNHKKEALEGLASLQRQIWQAVLNAKPDVRNPPDRRYINK